MERRWGVVGKVGSLGEGVEDGYQEQPPAQVVLQSRPARAATTQVGVSVPS